MRRVSLTKEKEKGVKVILNLGLENHTPSGDTCVLNPSLQISHATLSYL